MSKKKKSPRYQFMIGILSFIWAELKTMNLIKIRSLWQIVAAKMRMRLSTRAKSKIKATHKNQLLRETSYRLSA